MIPTGPVPKPMDEMPAFIAKWRDERHAAIPTPPERLYHYTNTSGLIGIFKSKELWATDVLYTNDRTEVLHTLALLIDLVMSAKPDRRIDVAADTMLIAAETLYEIVEVFAISLCAKDDLLSQWRGYGRTSGYSLGFDASLLKRLSSNDVMLTPVLYDTAEQKRLISDLVDRWRVMFKGANAQDFDYQRRRLAAFVFGQALSFLEASFKNVAFEEEEEWRLVYRRQVLLQYEGPLPVDFRERLGMVMPYARFPLPPITEDSAPVRRIVLGPTEYPKLAGFGLVQFLKSIGYREELIQVVPSVVPLRRLD